MGSFQLATQVPRLDTYPADDLERHLRARIEYLDWNDARTTPRPYLSRRRWRLPPPNSRLGDEVAFLRRRFDVEEELIKTKPIATNRMPTAPTPKASQRNIRDGVIA
jgi:hypothetical protein